MDPVTVGMTIRSIDDRSLGTVASVHDCCVCFLLRDSRNMSSATWRGIFNSQSGVVSLVYTATEPHRYSCPIHTADAEGASELATGALAR
jgi:hypothetical protein